MSLHGKEKIWFLINRLLDEREVTEAGQPVALHPMNDLNGHYEKMDFIQLTGLRGLRERLRERFS